MILKFIFKILLLSFLLRKYWLYLDDIAILKDTKVFRDYGKTDKLVVPEVCFFNKDGFLLENENTELNLALPLKIYQSYLMLNVSKLNY